VTIIVVITFLIFTNMLSMYNNFSSVYKKRYLSSQVFIWIGKNEKLGLAIFIADVGFWALILEYHYPCSNPDLPFLSCEILGKLTCILFTSVFSSVKHLTFSSVGRERWCMSGACYVPCSELMLSVRIPHV